jgi:hypothetical protein
VVVLFVVGALATLILISKHSGVNATAARDTSTSAGSLTNTPAATTTTIDPNAPKGRVATYTNFLADLAPTAAEWNSAISTSGQCSLAGGQLPQAYNDYFEALSNLNKELGTAPLVRVGKTTLDSLLASATSQTASALQIYNDWAATGACQVAGSQSSAMLAPAETAGSAANDTWAVFLNAYNHEASTFKLTTYQTTAFDLEQPTSSSAASNPAVNQVPTTQDPVSNQTPSVYPTLPSNPGVATPGGSSSAS